MGRGPESYQFSGAEEAWPDPDRYRRALEAWAEYLVRQPAERPRKPRKEAQE